MRKKPIHPIEIVRLTFGINQTELAAKMNITQSTISKIERGENSPTVSSLHKLSNALGVPITNLFKQEVHQIVVFTKKDDAIHIQSKGLVIEGLGSGLPHQQLEPFCMIIDPETENTTDPAIHSGEEFIYCLDGEIEYLVDDKKFQMKPGDSLLFKATHPHSWKNLGKTQAKVIMVFQTDRYQPVPHRL